MNKRQIINKILHDNIETNQYEDYTDYKKLITEIENWHNNELNKIKTYSSKLYNLTMGNLMEYEAKLHKKFFTQSEFEKNYAKIMNIKKQLNNILSC